jgi:hypothetical protein
MLDVRGGRVDDVDGEVIGYLGGVAMSPSATRS